MDFKALFSYLKEIFTYFVILITNLFRTQRSLLLRLLAVSSQLTLDLHRAKSGKVPKLRPKATPAFRQLWVLLSKHYADWESVLVYFKPKSVIRWHRQSFASYWTKKSKPKRGRPAIGADTITLINTIHKENPLLSPEKIRERLLLMNIIDAPSANTIAKYLPSTRKPPSQKQLQSWKTFLANHAFQTWGMDFFTVPTLTFKILYVLIIINHGTRKIEHFAVTMNPHTNWLKQQLRNATPYDHKPKYLVHDNDPVFTSKAFQAWLKASGIISKKTSYKSPWQNPYAEQSSGYYDKN